MAAVATLLMAGCNKADDASRAPTTGTTVGSAIDDSFVTASVKSALLAEEAVKSLDIKVETHNGEVLLSGFVNDQSQIDLAHKVASGVSGVKTVDNKLSLKGPPATVGETAEDIILTTKIKAALLSDASVKSFAISVETHKGEVQLSGFVNNQGQIDRATTLARGVTGVLKVQNDLSIKK
jgi:hyperosmotically inducible protein